MRNSKTLHRHTFTALALALALAIPGALALAARPGVEIAIEVQREVVHTGASGETQVTREPVDSVSPGDVLVYTLTARNQGNAPAVKPRLSDPIPTGTVLVLDSVVNGEATPSASLDGGKSWQDFPVQIEQPGPDGRPELVPAPAERYTHLRWTLPGTLDPGESRQVEFKVLILQ